MFVGFNDVARNCGKILLLLLNGFCALVAFFTIYYIVGEAKMLMQYGEERGTLNSDILIIVVCVMFLSSIAFGSVAAVKINVKMLYTYCGVFFTTFILELLVGTYLAHHRPGIETRMSEWLRKDFSKNTTDDIVHIDLWDNMQITYECCGFNGPEDYGAVRKQISLSCCPLAFDANTDSARQQLYRTCVESSSFYHDGCEDKILNVIRSISDWLFNVFVGCFWLEIACVLCGAWLALNAHKTISVYIEGFLH